MSNCQTCAPVKMSSIKSRAVIWRAGITQRTDRCWTRIEKKGSGKSLFIGNHNFLNWSKNFTCLLLNFACNWCGQPNFSQDCWHKLSTICLESVKPQMSDLVHRWSRALKRKKKEKEEEKRWHKKLPCVQEMKGRSTCISMQITSGWW